MIVLQLTKEKVALLKNLVDEEIEALEKFASIGFLSEETEERFELLDRLQEDLERFSLEVQK